METGEQLSTETMQKETNVVRNYPKRTCQVLCITRWTGFLNYKYTLRLRDYCSLSLNNLPKIKTVLTTTRLKQSPYTGYIFLNKLNRKKGSWTSGQHLKLFNCKTISDFSKEESKKKKVS